MGPAAGLHLTVMLLSFTSVTSISEGESTPAGEENRDEKESVTLLCLREIVHFVCPYLSYE